MVWVARDTFDTYTPAASISGVNNGTGWSAGWVLGAGTVTTETAPAGGQGGVAGKALGSGAGEAHRLFTAITDGTLHCAIYPSSNSGMITQHGVSIFQGAGNLIITRLGLITQGQIEVYNNDTTTYEAVGAYSANTWNTLDIVFGGAVTAGKYRVSVNGGAYSGDKGFNGTLSTGFDQVRFLLGGADITSMYFDDIRDGGPVKFPMKLLGKQAVNRASTY